MIEYILMTIAYSLGAWFSALQKIMGIRTRNPKASINEVKNTYLEEEWNTILAVGACWVVDILAWYIIRMNHIKIPLWFEQWGVYAFNLLAGWCLHRLIFKLLGTTEKAVEKKIEDKINGSI